MFSKKVRVDVIAILEGARYGPAPATVARGAPRAKSTGRGGVPQGLRDLDRPDWDRGRGTAIALRIRMRLSPISSAAVLLLLSGLRQPRAGPRRRHERDAAPAGRRSKRTRRRRRRPPPPGRPAADPDGYDWNAERRRDAERRREHARQHAAAAEFLEQFEDRECRHVPAASRAACPLLGPVVRIDDVPGGIRATFADAKRVPTVDRRDALPLRVRPRAPFRRSDRLPALCARRRGPPGSRPARDRGRAPGTRRSAARFESAAGSRRSSSARRGADR